MRPLFSLPLTLLFYALAVLAYPDRSFDFDHATAEQVSRFDSCFFIGEGDVARMPAEAFAGLQSGCAKDLRIYSLNAKQTSFLPLAAIRVMDLHRLKDEQVFAGFSAEQVGAFSTEFGGTCSNLRKQSVEYIRASSFAGFTRACVKNWRNEVYRGISTTEALQNLSPDAVAGFDRSIASIPPEIFRVLTSEQFQNFDSSTFKACFGLTADQLSFISFAVWGTGLRAQCLREIPAESIGGLKDGHIMAMPNSLISQFSSGQVSQFNMESICPILTAERIIALGENSFSRLGGKCIAKMEDNILMTLPKDFIEGIFDGASGFRYEQWRSLSAERVSWFLGVAFNHLSADACRAMTLEQFESICRVSLAGLSGNCMNSFSPHYLKSLDPERASMISPRGFAGLSLDHFRQIPPESMRVLGRKQLQYLDGSVCAGMRPVQFTNLSTEVFQPECVAKLSQVLTDSLSFQRLQNFTAPQFRSLTSMQLRHLIAKFGDEFWNSLTLDKVDYPGTGDEDAQYDRMVFWKRSECFAKLFEQELLPLRPGAFSPNWMILASRPIDVQIDYGVSTNFTFAGGLKSASLQRLTGFQIRAINPNMFGNAILSLADISSNSLITNISWPQIASIPPQILSAMPHSLFDKLLDRLLSGNTVLAFSCNQIGNLTKGQVEWMLNRRRLGDAFNEKQIWCERPVNDTILYDGQLGFRWSEVKKGWLYANPCLFNTSEWSLDSIMEKRSKEEIFDREYAKTPRDNLKKVTGCRCGIKVCYNDDCYEEDAARCKPGSGRSPRDGGGGGGGDGGGNRGGDGGGDGSNGNENSSGTSVTVRFSIVSAVLAGLCVVGFIYRRPLISKSRQIRDRIHERFFEDRTPLLS